MFLPSAQRFSAAALLVLFAGAAGAAVPATVAGAEASSLSFEKHIRPIFKIYCFDCHGGEAEIEGGLDLRLRRLGVKGGDSGPAIAPGKPNASLLLTRIRSGEMPPREKKLEDEEVALIRDWIAGGAQTARPEPEQLAPGIGITPEDREFWSFQPLHRPSVPEVVSKDRVRTPVDAFLVAAMEAQGLTFSRDAEHTTLLRRAALDLTGLPPTPDEVHELLADTGVGAYERAVDRLLASPRYGERWGRHWLDVAGYADSEGYTISDPVRSFAYKYRDYVVRSFNADKPFDQFIVEQLAGDELVAPPYERLSSEAIEKLTATGFLRMAADGTGSGAPDQQAARQQVVADTIKIVSGALLGLTLDCARCHDHRHDPILQTDYYSVRAIFEPAYDAKNWRVPAARRISLATDDDRTSAAAIEAEAQAVAAERAAKQKQYIAAALDKELEKFEASRREAIRVAYYTPGDKRTEEQKEIFRRYPFLRLHAGNLYQYNQASADDLKKYDERMNAIRARKPFEDFLRVLTEVPGQVPTTHLLHRGDVSQPRHAIGPGGLSVARPEGQRLEIAPDDSGLPSTGRRLAFAHYLTSGEHPLVARVIVNRVWMHHFGRGLVATPADFGRLGDLPTHPELLDWLASEFVASGWSVKRLHKLIMTSTVYRQRSRRDPVRDSIDAGNVAYWRFPIRRLEAEVIRDQILAVSGVLNAKMFGPPVPVVEDEVGQIVVGPLPAADEKSIESSDHDSAARLERNRRTLYAQVRRSMPVSMLRQFDMPVMEVNCERRTSSTVSTQSLMLMNSGFALRAAERFARRLRREAGSSRADQIVRAWQLAFGRRPAPSEIERSKSFLAQRVEHSIATSAATEESATASPQPGRASQAVTKAPDHELIALTDLCHALLGTNEFLYVD